MNLVSKASKSLLLSASLLLMAPAAMAGSPGELEERIDALEAMIAELKAELADQKAQTDETLERIEAAPAAQSSGNGFTSGDTQINWGGIIDVDLHVSDFTDGEVAGNSIARDFYIPSVTPIGGEGEDPATDFSAKASRFFVTASKQVGEHKIGGRLEMDFLGSSQGNEAVSNSYSPRLRRAYVTYDNWLIGQEWSTFQNTSAIPESASFLALPDGMVFIRQPQVRYTSGNFQFAIENPNANTSLAGLSDDSAIPDVVARYNLKGDFGNISVAGLGRQLKSEVGSVNEEVYGYALSVAGQVKVGAKNDIRFNVTGGDGVGRYIGLGITRSAGYDASGSFEAIPAFGGYVAYRHVLPGGSRLNLGVGGVSIDNLDSAASTTTKQSLSGYVAYMWDIAPKVTLGAELMHGVREDESGAEGELNRFTFSTKYAF